MYPKGDFPSIYHNEIYELTSILLTEICQRTNGLGIKDLAKPFICRKQSGWTTCVCITGLPGPFMLMHKWCWLSINGSHNAAPVNVKCCPLLFLTLIWQCSLAVELNYSAYSLSKSFLQYGNILLNFITQFTHMIYIYI